MIDKEGKISDCNATLYVPERWLNLSPSRTYREIRSAIDAADLGVDTWYARWWAADALTLMGRYRQAVEEYPPPNYGRASMQVERLLSLKVAAKIAYTSTDLLALLGPRVTRYGRENIELVRRAADVLVNEEPERERIQRLREWAKEAESRPYDIYIGSPVGYWAARKLDIRHFQFSKHEPAAIYAKDIARRAENMVREEAGVPRVGEGWISETRLYRELAEAFPEYEVQQHASPPWLGRQHLDVFIPGLSVGIEYQGAQHYRPIEFFGGQEAFEATVKRDARNRRLCTRNGVRLVLVHPGYRLADVVAEIRGTQGP
ncbi:hypothetical protein QP116_07010 [Pseudoglutamicibacter cumminsii]|uniref:Uncharacterized protein n=1 Tax=Pseudoglutamicibacter cumminsii TaxID=156979 RepID=A0AAP4C708_9MICC|nr:hypothetical protein [Pseudoglutamicibacter cumminsii]MDK6275478.1 hypothetical protein [Pseudoglutamicibacter cumminsii]